MITHPELVRALVKPGEAILKELTPADCNVWHLASCIPSEAGELFDAVKKQVIYRKPLDRANVVEELGDLEFYMEALRQAYGITREETLAANIAKLSVRYDKLSYSDKSAAERADKPKTMDEIKATAWKEATNTNQVEEVDDTREVPGHPDNPIWLSKSPSRRIPRNRTLLIDDGLNT